MKHKFLITALATVSLLGASTVATLSHPHTVEAKSYIKSYTTPHSIVYKNNKGTLRITSAQGFLAKNGNYKPEHQIILYGTFYNNSSHGIVPADFFNDHFRAYQITRNTWHQLGMYGGASIYDSTSHIESLEDIANDAVRPHHSVKFALVDEDGLNYWQGQKIAVRTYKDANFLGFKPLASKKFGLDIYGYKAKMLRKIKAEKKAAKLAKKKKQAKIDSNNFYKIANKYDVYWGTNKGQEILNGLTSENNGAFIRNVGVVSPLVMINGNDLQICFYFDNHSNNTINIMDMINKYFNITDSNDQKIQFKIDDIKRYNIAKPYKNSAVTLTNTNNISVSNGVMFKVKNEFSTNIRQQYIDAAK